MNPSPAVPVPTAGASRRHVAAVLLTVVLALLTAMLAVPAGARADSAPSLSAGRFTPIAPVRVYDSATVGQPFGPGETRTIDLSKAFTAPASAVVINLTAAGGTANSYQTVFPTGTTPPVASNLNELAGSVRANSVTVAVGQGGAAQNKIDLFNSVGSVRLVVDVTGWYGKGGDAANPGTGYVPLAAPVRLFDSRQGPGPLTNTYPKNVGIATVDYGSPAVNRTIRAVAMNITVAEPTGAGYVSLWDGSGMMPTTSSINFGAGQTVANLAVVPVRCADTDCNEVTFSIYNNSSPSTQVIGDIQGMYATAGQPGSTVFTAMSPRRLVDTRDSSPFSVLGTGGTGTVGAGTWGQNAKAVSLNVTAVTPQLLTYVTVWATPSDASPPPAVSNLNARVGDVVPNAVQSRLGGSGSGFKVFNSQGWTNVIVDVGGVFVTDPALSSSSSAKVASADATGAPAGGLTAR